MSKKCKRRSSRNTPSYAFGIENAIDMAQFAAPIASSMSTGDKQDGGSAAGDVLGGAASGASAGMALGPWGAAAGAVVGTVGGIFKSSSRQRAKKRAERAAKATLDNKIANANIQNKLALSESMAAEFDAENINMPTFKYGVEGNARVNNKEVIQYPNGKSTRVRDNSGIIDNVSTVLPNQSTVYSDSIYTPDGSTISDKANEQFKILDKKYTSGSKFARQSKELNDMKAKKQLDKLKNYQKAYRELSGIETGSSFAFGVEDISRLAKSAKSALTRDYKLPKSNASMPFTPGEAFNPYEMTNLAFKDKPEIIVDTLGKGGYVPPYKTRGAGVGLTPNITQETTPQEVKSNPKIIKKATSKSTESPNPAIRDISPISAVVTPMKARGPISTPTIPSSENTDSGVKSRMGDIKSPITSGVNDNAFGFDKMLNLGSEIMADYGALSAYRYNKNVGNTQHDIVLPEYNPYDSTANKAMRARRINDTASIEANKRNKAIARYNANNFGGAGQSAAYALASDVMLDRNLQDTLQQNQRINNDYVAQYAQALSNSGDKIAQARAYAEDATARNKGARDAHRAAAAEAMSMFAQNKMAMRNKQRNNKGKIEALKSLLAEGFSKADINELLKYYN